MIVVFYRNKSDKKGYTIPYVTKYVNPYIVETDGNAGVSIRAANDVSVRTGSNRGRAVRQNAMKQ